MANASGVAANDSGVKKTLSTTGVAINAMAAMNQRVTVSPPPLHAFVKEVNPALEEVILKAIRRKPEARWQSAQAFAQALDNLDTLDPAALQAEREQEEADNGSPQNQNHEFGMPLWKVGAIAAVVIFTLIALVFIAQLLRHSP